MPLEKKNRSHLSCSVPHYRRPDKLGPQQICVTGSCREKSRRPIADLIGHFKSRSLEVAATDYFGNQMAHEKWWTDWYHFVKFRILGSLETLGHFYLDAWPANYNFTFGCIGEKMQSIPHFFFVTNSLNFFFNLSELFNFKKTNQNIMMSQNKILLNNFWKRLIFLSSFSIAVSGILQILSVLSFLHSVYVI